MKSIMLDHFDGEFMWKLDVMCQPIVYLLHIDNKASSELANFRTSCALCIGHNEEGAFSIVQTVW